MGNFINKIKDKGFSILDHLNDLALGYKDKVIILLGETGVGKSTFINEITGNSEKSNESSKLYSCTKDISFTRHFYDGYNYFFVDTPGLNDAGGDITNIEEIRKIKPGIISTVILVKNYTICRLTDSYKKALIQFMKIFPSEHFFEHVILVETFYSDENKLEKEPLINALSGDNDLLSFINENKIKIPDNICTFTVNLMSNKKDKSFIFEEILEIIKNMPPFFKRYYEEENNKVTEEREGDEIYIKYEEIKKISFTDFNDITTEKEEIIESSRYLESEKHPDYIIVERRKTEEMRQSFWLWKWLPCFHDEYHIFYYQIKIYDIKGKKYKLEDFYEDTWESDDNKGEDYRRKIESELSSNIDRKLLNN